MQQYTLQSRQTPVQCKALLEDRPSPKAENEFASLYFRGKMFDSESKKKIPFAALLLLTCSQFHQHFTREFFIYKSAFL